jgi:hypothetical protein
MPGVMTKTAIVYLSKTIFLGFLSSGIFMASAVVAPLKTETAHKETHIPAINISVTEFSAPFSALEDDYYVGDYEEEKIPQNIKSIELAAGTVDMFAKPMQMPTDKIALPEMSLSAMASSDTYAVNTPLTPNVTAGFPGVETQLQPQFQAQQGIPDALAQRIPHHWIEGKIELVGGLAITDARDQIQVGWFVDGKVERTGKIDVYGGSYQIKVDRLEGELIAELVDAKGFLRGEKILDLTDLPNRASDLLEIKNIDIQIEPYDFGLKGQFISIYHTPLNKSIVEDATGRVGQHDLYFQAKPDGKIHEESFNPKSTAMLTASRSQFRDTMILADFEKKQNIRMFPEKFLNALFDTIQLDPRARDAGMIWGLITKNEIPAAGYHVKIAKHSEQQPIYFSTYIASKDLQETSSDGQYVFVGLNDGEYEIDVFDGKEQHIDTKLVSVKAGFVSQAEFEVGRKRSMTLRPFDPLSPVPKLVQLSAQGSSSVHELETEGMVKIPVLDGTDPFLVYTRPANSLTDTSVFAGRTSKTLDIPVLNAPWWERIQRERKIQISDGVIIGFIDTEAPFEVFLEETKANTRILYFNHSGQIIPAGDASQLANGFIVYGAGEGLKTLILQSEAGWITTEMAYLDGETVSLMYKSL